MMIEYLKTSVFLSKLEKMKQQKIRKFSKEKNKENLLKQKNN